MRGSELIGVMVAGSEEDPERPIGYAISAQEVYRSISTSMGGLSVRPLAALENSINANNQTGGSQRNLAVLSVRQLFDVDTPVRHIKTLSYHHTLSLVTNIQTGNAALTALLRLGFFCAKIELDFTTTQKSRLTTTPSWNRAKRVGEWLLTSSTTNWNTYRCQGKLRETEPARCLCDKFLFKQTSWFMLMEGGFKDLMAPKNTSPACGPRMLCMTSLSATLMLLY